MERMGDLDKNIINSIIAEDQYSNEDFEKEHFMEEKYKDSFVMYQFKCEFVFMSNHATEINLSKGSSTRTGKSISKDILD